MASDASEPTDINDTEISFQNIFDIFLDMPPKNSLSIFEEGILIPDNDSPKSKRLIEDFTENFEGELNNNAPSQDNHNIPHWPGNFFLKTVMKEMEFPRMRIQKVNPRECPRIFCHVRGSS